MSAAITLTLPGDYGYVLLAAASSFFLQTYHMVLSAKARKESGLMYPIAYAESQVAAKDPKAYAFNCAQRAQTNFTENLTPFLGALLIAGLKYPIPSAGLGAGWVFSRFIYASGYTTFGPKGRGVGFIGSALADLSLKFMALYAAYSVSFGQ
ncbi:hypothetical protein MCOR02_004385 [Pyricularia oryzae]|uniref:Microsomal glutathione S-transferase 3 n=5 Tax=Pyricularia TaxID=48558 RepID=A0ABQ8N4H0_PYRGI|nr:uncharacterized protein MGG_06907 [Pyricularia oryzae 70-15]KAH8842216.1 hypothetical protein MCOR01_006142 [Pyricularia oryzae]KAI6291101.1 hypothetical protein MCOR33_010847 [Pyricularia grisea]EHA57029.1 hypothetical protein MGG_06907 [Pyricularia oryzae 70-15]KAH9435449.1 hypothetical protein MCOR02_004385 [Pyricularia oryzae]KAI6252805.1 hypothetical protein MCOR19_010608 [Pyricularia oryzae]